MKKLLLFSLTQFLLAVSVLTQLGAQTGVYQPFPTSDAYWSFRTEIGTSPANTFYSELIWEGDTTIGAHTYKKIYHGQSHSDYHGGIRQDIPSQKLYYVDTLGVEYDISVDQFHNVGDTMVIPKKYMEAFGFGMPAPADLHCLVTVVDSILVGSNYHTAYWLYETDVIWFTSYYIVGVGFREELGFEWFRTLLCFSKDHSVAYSVGGVWDNQCNLFLDVEREEALNATTYPNPTNGPVTIDLGETYNDIAVTVTNLVGQTVATYSFSGINQVSFELEGKPGVYLVQVMVGDKVSVMKVLKE